MSSQEDADPEALQERVDELEATVQRMLPGRRAFLAAGAGAAVGAVGMQSASNVGEASDGTAVGQIGTSSEKVNVVAHDVTSDSVDTDDAQFRDQPFRDVRDYGAVGDGSTDDTAAVQSALDADGIIWIPHSHTFLADGLDTPTSGDTAVVGRGTIQRRGGEATDWILRTQGDGDIVRDITLDGADATTSGRGEGLRTLGSNTRVDSVTVTDTPSDGGATANAFVTENGSARYHNCTADGAYYAGFRADARTEITNPEVVNSRRGVVGNPGAESYEVKIRGGYIEPDSTVASSRTHITLDSGNASFSNIEIDGVTLAGDVDATAIKLNSFDKAEVDVTGKYTNSTEFAIQFVNGGDFRVQGDGMVGALDLRGDGYAEVSGEFDASGQTYAMYIRSGDHVRIHDADLTSDTYLARDESGATRVTFDRIAWEQTDSGTGDRAFVLSSGTNPGDYRLYDFSFIGHGEARGDMEGTSSKNRSVLINGQGANGGDPGSTGVWNGASIEDGVRVYDVTNSALYVREGGTWDAA